MQSMWSTIKEKWGHRDISQDNPDIEIIQKNFKKALINTIKVLQGNTGHEWADGDPHNW